MFRMNRRRHQNRSWLWSMIGLTGAFLAGREAGKRMGPNSHHEHHQHRQHSSWNQEEGIGQE